MRVEHLSDCVTLYLGDCRDILPALDKVVDSGIVSDVPYGIRFQHSGKGNIGGASSASFTRKVDTITGDAEKFDPAFLLSVAAPLVLFGANHYYARLPDGGTFHVWDKVHGCALVDSFSDAEFIWTSFPCRSEVVRYLWKGLLQGGEKGSPKFHVAQKPIEVMRRSILLLPSSVKVIIDPFMGSGSTGVAAINLGRKFIGIEIEPKYFDISCRRIEKELSQPRMFIEPEARAAVKQEGFL